MRLHISDTWIKGTVGSIELTWSNSTPAPYPEGYRIFIQNESGHLLQANPNTYWVDSVPLGVAGTPNNIAINRFRKVVISIDLSSGNIINGHYHRQVVLAILNKNNNRVWESPATQLISHKITMPQVQLLDASIRDGYIKINLLKTWLDKADAEYSDQNLTYKVQLVDQANLKVLEDLSLDSIDGNVSTYTSTNTYNGLLYTFRVIAQFSNGSTAFNQHFTKAIYPAISGRAKTPLGKYNVRGAYIKVGRKIYEIQAIFKK